MLRNEILRISPKTFITLHLRIECSKDVGKDDRTGRYSMVVGREFSRYLNSSAVIGKYVVGRKLKDSGTLHLV